MRTHPGTRYLVLAAIGLLGSAAPPDVEPPEVEMVSVVVAARDLYQGVRIDRGDVRVVQLPRHALPEVDLPAIEDVVGSKPWERILAHEPIRSERFARVGAGNVGLNAELARRERLIGVEVTGADIEPGSCADVSLPDGTLLVSATRLLGIERDADATYALLAVSASGAELVAHHEREGLSLAGCRFLRPKIDPAPERRVTLLVQPIAGLELPPGSFVDVKVRTEDGLVSVNGWIAGVPEGAHLPLQVYERYADLVLTASRDGALEIAPARVLSGP